MSDLIDEEEFMSVPDPKKFKVNIKKALGIALIAVACLQVLSGVINLPSNFIYELYNVTLPLSFLAGGLVALWVVIPFVKTSWDVAFSTVLKPSSFLVTGLSMLFYISLLPLAEYLTSLIPTDHPGWIERLYRQFTEGFEMLIDFKVAGFITVCILAPVIEEVIFRGILLRGLLQNGMKAAPAIILSAFLFGLAHLNPWQFLGAGMLGGIFGYVYYRTGSLWLVILLHALNNGLSFFMMVKYSTMEDTVTDINDTSSVFIFLGVGLLLGGLLYKLTKNKISWN